MYMIGQHPEEYDSSDFKQVAASGNEQQTSQEEMERLQAEKVESRKDFLDFANFVEGLKGKDG